MGECGYQFSFYRLVFWAVLALGFGPSLTYAKPVADPSPALSPVVRPTLLRDDPLLQQKITLEATDCSVTEVFAQLSPKCQVNFVTSTRVGDQRITLHLTDQPLYIFMGRLIALLSHSPAKPHGYYWDAPEHPSSPRPVYELWRDLRSIREEEYELSYPRREAAVMLRNIRDLCRMTSEERAKYQGDYPYFPLSAEIKEQPFGHDLMPVARAMKALSDAQLDELMQGEKIPLDPVLFSEEISAVKQRQREQKLHEQEISRLIGTRDPYPTGVPESSVVAPSISVAAEGDSGKTLSRSYLYAIRLNGLDQGLLLDPYDTKKNPNPSRIARYPSAVRPKQSEPLFDLSEALGSKNATAEQRGDVGFTLQALAKAAHISIYQEDFLKPNPATGLRSEGLKPTKGTLSELILAICNEWNYREQKVGDDYFFWSRSWAMDRAVDVPPRLVSKWKSRFASQKGMTADDHAEIAAALTWPQISMTLAMTLPEGCPSSLDTYKMFRFLGRLTPLQRGMAFSSEGLALASLSPWQQQDFVTDYQEELGKVSEQQLAQAVALFRTEQDGPPNVPKPIQRILFQVKAEGKQFMGTIDVVQTAIPTDSGTPDAAAPKNSK